MQRRHGLLLASTSLAALSIHALGAQSSLPVATQFDKLHFRSIGPATMSGRIADLAVYEADTRIFYVATAHGGLWKTTSNGAMFSPMLQDNGLMSIGAVAVSQSNPDLVWVGSGESNNRQSTSWGDGLFRSGDGGKTWQFMGLRDSKHINRIVIDPNNNDIVLVAATGPLFGSGGERGVYKTVDGGRTWKRVLFVDDETGANDLVMVPSDPRTMYASTYQRRRTSCCMNGGGPGSGIWRSTDEGDTWTRLASGVPAGSLGRIGLTVYRKNPGIVYAEIEAPTPPGARGGGGGGGGAGAGGTSGLYRSDDAGASWRRVTTVNVRPMYFSQVRVDPTNPDHVIMAGVKMQETMDAGKTMETNGTPTIHDDIHAIWWDPNNANHVMIGDDGGLGITYDGTKTWEFVPNLPVGLFYHVGYDLEYPYNVCGGMQDNYSWCGPSATRYDRGIFNHDWTQVEGGDGFVAFPDLRNPNIIYSEIQDGALIRRNKVTGESKSIRPTALNVTPAPKPDETFRFDWNTPLIQSPHEPGTLLVAANKVFKSTDRGDSWTVLSPDLTTNANRDTIVTMGVRGKDIAIAKDDGISQWPAIVALAESPKQTGVYYTGTDDGILSVSRDGGKTWANITSKVPGFPTGGYVSKIAPSRYDAGTVYMSVDNHLLNDFAPYIWASHDFGASWTSIVNNLSDQNVRTITEDQKNPDVIYIGTETGIDLSLDRGKTWQRLKANFPDVRVDEITLHPRDNAMLVASHGRALWILDHLEPIQEYSAMQRASGDAKLFTVPAALELKLKHDRNDEFWGHQVFVGENPPNDAVVNYFVKTPLADPKLRITDALGKTVREEAIPASKNVAGIETACWDLRVEPIPPIQAAAGRGGRGAGAGGAGRRGGGAGIDSAHIALPPPTAGYMPLNPCAPPDSTGRRGGGGGGGAAAPILGPYVAPGTYTVALISGGKAIDSKPLKVIGDPQAFMGTTVTAEAKAQYQKTATDLHEAERKGSVPAGELNALYPQMMTIRARIDTMSSVPAPVKAQFAALAKDFDSLRVKFGVPIAVGGGRGGGAGGGAAGLAALAGADTSAMTPAQRDSARQAVAPAAGRRGGGDPRNALQRVATAKSNVMAFWEMPSAATMKQASDAKRALSAAETEAGAWLGRARAMSTTLSTYGLTLTVTPAIRSE